MRINQNIGAMNAYRNLSAHQNALAKPLERLSSGLRINRAADDAAGLAISETMRTQTNGLTRAQANTQDGISLLQTAEGGLNETHAVLQRMRTLAVQAANGVNNADQLRAIQSEMTQLTDQIDQIATGSQFNGMTLLDGTFRNKNLQVGANSGDTSTISITSGLTPATAATPAGVALWDVYQPGNLAGVADSISVSQASGGPSATVSMVPKPTSVADLVGRLNADPSFSAGFTASTGFHTFADGTTVADANVIIMAKTPAAGTITATGIPASSTQSDPGSDAIPEHAGGFGSVDLLGGPIDVTSQPGSTTSTVTTGGGPSRGFGVANDVPSPTTTTTVTQSWGSGADDAIGRIDRAIALVSTGRASIGAAQNGLEHTLRNLGVSTENMAVSESRIRDADIAKEVTAMQRHQIMVQASMQMLAQANQVPNSILRLLQ